MTSKQSPRKAEAAKLSTAILAPHFMRRRRKQVDDWLHVNGVDPGAVSHDHAIHVEGDTIRYRVIRSGTTGGPVVDPESGQAVTVEQTARCIRPAPWLAPSVSQAA